MRKLAMITLLSSAAILAGCKDKPKCTPEEAQAKATELMTKIQGLATSDPAKLATLGQKAADFATAAQKAQDDPGAVCEAADKLLAEISK
ncbi:MAG: hypothetical protein ORN49_12030 [Rhodobacteraceae bacterium]|nr:hypothetical protein [Paracoccaceae bacterium]